MKFVGIAGSIAPESYNRKLMNYIARHFTDLADISVLNINDVPMFNEDQDATNTPVIQNLAKQIADADGVILATPEHNHTTTAALKSVIEWLSYKVHPFNQKPVLIVGASYFTQGSSRAQLDLREILEAPGVGAYVMPGDEFLLGNAKEAFDEAGNLKDAGTVSFLRSVMEKFVRWVNVLSAMDVLKLADEQKQNEVDAAASASVSEAQTNNSESADTGTSASVNDGQHDDSADTGASVSVKVNDQLMDLISENEDWKQEDLLAQGKTNTTITSVPKRDPHWVERASEITHAAAGNDYVQLDSGVLTVNQINQLLKSMPVTINFVDENNEFVYFNQRTKNPTKAAKVGSPLVDCHPDKPQVLEHVKQVLHLLRSGKREMVQLPAGYNPEKPEMVIDNYIAMHDEAGNYRGTNEVVLDFWPIVQKYLELSGKKIVDDSDANNDVDRDDGADTGASASVK